MFWVMEFAWSKIWDQTKCNSDLLKENQSYGYVKDIMCDYKTGLWGRRITKQGE